MATDWEAWGTLVTITARDHGRLDRVTIVHVERAGDDGALQWIEYEWEVEGGTNRAIIAWHAVTTITVHPKPAPATPLG